MWAAFAPLISAQSGQQQSRPFAPGTCGPVDPSYIRIAEQTGGQPMFLQPSEMAAAGHLMRETTSSNSDALLYATAHLRGQAREYTVPIDTTITRVTFSLSFDAPGTKLTIDRPSGAAVTSGEGGVEFSEWTCGRIVTVGSPEKGAWQVRLSGTGRFWLRVTGQSDLYILNAEFVRLGGRPGHEGYFRIAGQPLAGRPQTLRTTLSGALRSAEFKLVDAGGEVIVPVEANEAGSDPEDHEHIGTLTLPLQPFRVAVSGLDANGLAYQRMFLTQFRASTVEIALRGSREDVRPGSATTLPFVVENHGASDTFQILAVDSTGTILAAEPARIILGPGAQTVVKIPLNVPGEKPPGSSFAVTVTVTSTSQPEISNGTSVEFTVGSS